MTCAPRARRGEVAWQSNRSETGQTVETLSLQSGASLILSSFDAGEGHQFQYTEPADVFGIGFHLKGGARFDMERASFATEALSIWAIGAPKGSTSFFTLPAPGFRTVSIRFDLDAASAWFEDGKALTDKTREALGRARDSVGVTRLASLSARSITRLQSMFASGYGGAARRLYLESCVLELIAAQIVQPMGFQSDRRYAHTRHRTKLFAARDHLDQDFRDPPTISELAKMVGTNEFTLKRGFKEVFGTTIFAYVSERRMEHATWLLRQGMSVSLAAREVGYDCPRSFAAAYRRQLGHTPSAVRRSLI